MKNGNRQFLCVLLWLGLTGAASAQTGDSIVQNPETGHYYQVFGQNGVSWGGADTFVGTLYSLELNGDPCGAGGFPACGPDAIAPHLATITSAREDDFIETSVRGAATVLSRPETWVGGFQSAPGGAGDNWVWVNAEGAISTPQVPLPTYSNWLASEPNDNTGANSEEFLATGLGNAFGWNDEGALGNIGGFIVEWDVPLDAGECADIDGCVTIEGQILSFPAGSNPNNATISFNSFEFLDPRVAAGTCGEVPLTIFGGSGIGPATPAMIIPPYLCGSPRFVVVAVDSSGLVIETGTVGVIHDTSVVLPGNVYPDGGVSVCEDPIPHTPFTDGDPQYQDVVVWQTTDPTKMREHTAGSGIFAGAAGEFTNECGTSRARVKGSSYFGIGLHIDFGDGNTYDPVNFLDNFNSFVALTRYKLELLEDSVDHAIATPNGILKKGDRKKMRNMVRNAIKNFDDGNYAGALDHIENFTKFIVPARYGNVPGQNFQGEHTMRGQSAEFMLRVKIIPYIPFP